MIFSWLCVLVTGYCGTQESTAHCWMFLCESVYRRRLRHAVASYMSHDRGETIDICDWRFHAGAILKCWCAFTNDDQRSDAEDLCSVAEWPPRNQVVRTQGNRRKCWWWCGSKTKVKFVWILQCVVSRLAPEWNDLEGRSESWVDCHGIISN